MRQVPAPLQQVLARCPLSAPQRASKMFRGAWIQSISLAASAQKFSGSRCQAAQVSAYLDFFMTAPFVSSFLFRVFRGEITRTPPPALPTSQPSELSQL